MSEPTAPHPVLGRFYQEPGLRSAYVRNLFDGTAADYDLINALMSWGSGGWYRRRMLEEAGLRPGHAMLDVATGTGLTAIEARGIVGPGGSVTGVDLSAGMLAVARGRDAAHLLVQGSADALPFAPGSFDFAAMGYALRHVQDLTRFFAELARVLRPDGIVLILELGQPTREPTRSLARLYLRHVVPALSLLATRKPLARELMDYYWATIEACAPPERILAAMTAGGLADPTLSVELGLLRAYRATKP
ncbi:MAG: class I SAM-dependent methyltransferase [Geminicoccaceae bacterium]